MSKITFVADDDRTYEWSGGFGGTIISLENGVSQGDVRCLGGKLFYAFRVYPHRFSPNEVQWSLCDSTVESIRAMKLRFLGA